MFIFFILKIYNSVLLNHSYLVMQTYMIILVLCYA